MASTSTFESALELLRGSDANFGLCWVSTALSLLAAVLGIIFMEEDEVRSDTVTKVFAVQSIVFLLSQGFTVAKSLRDYHLGTLDSMTDVKPTKAYMVQVMLFFILAIVCSFYSLVGLAITPEWQAYFAMIIVWIVLNVLCLSKAIRDRHEASRFSGMPLHSQQSRLQHILAMCNGTKEYRAMLWLSTLLSVSLMLGIMWSWSDQILVIERKAYVSGMILWSLVSSFHLAKLVRDRADPVKSKELKTQMPFQVLVLASSVLSLGALLGGAFLMPLELRKRLFLLTGTCFTTTSAFYLAKHVRDRLEVKALCSQAGESDVHAEEEAAPVEAVVVADS